jgi:hypothetical protein
LKSQIAFSIKILIETQIYFKNPKSHKFVLKKNVNLKIKRGDNSNQKWIKGKKKNDIKTLI